MLFVTTDFEMAHKVPNQGNDEESLHGHTWELEVAVIPSDIGGPDDDDTEVDAYDVNTFDPAKVKAIVANKISSYYDHTLMVYEQDDMIDIFRELEKSGNSIIYVPFAPSAFNIARHLYNDIESELLRDNLHCEYVKLKEGNYSSATYAGDM